MEEIIMSQKQLVKDEEKLLEKGTFVIVKNDYSRTNREILWSMPDDVYPHRYCLEGWSFICERRDLIIQC